METRKKLETALYEAMRSNNDLRKRTLRMALASIKNADIDKGSPLDESGVLSVLQKEVKSRRESIADAQKANREDLVRVSEDEIRVLEEFLPRPLDEAALRELIQAAIVEVGATSPGDMGKVIKTVMSKVQGKATGDQISRIARELLQK